MLDSTLIHTLVGTAKNIVIGLLSTVTHKTPLSVDGYGKVKTWSTGTSILCAIQRKEKKIVASDGTEKISALQIIIPQSYVISVCDQITFPDGTVPKIQSVDSGILDSDGCSYITTVYF
jgi:hypothetical protein